MRYFIENKRLSRLEWLSNHSKICELKDAPLIYSPKRLCLFSETGENMVDSLVKIGPIACKEFEELIKIPQQKRIAESVFESLKGTPVDKPGKKGEMGYFRTRRTFDSLVPRNYSRTPNAPRLTARGNSFHGMNKALLIEIVKKITMEIKGSVVFEIDMSACHSRVAASLLPDDNVLQEALNKEHFWETQINQYIKKYIDNEIPMKEKQLKRMFKVAMYTSLNGGNPTSQDRLVDNLTANVKELLPTNHLTQSKVYETTKEIFNQFKLLEEVKDLNKRCFTNIGNHSYTYTVDRFQPYKSTASYKGISRVLQGFEVVILSVLTQHVIEMNGLPLSLDHDGLMAMFILKPGTEMDYPDVETLVKYIELGLSETITPWALFLLKSHLPIEIKRTWYKNSLTEF